MSDEERCSKCGIEIKEYPLSEKVYDDEEVSYLNEIWCSKCMCKFMDSKYQHKKKKDERIRIFWGDREVTNEDQNFDRRWKRNF